jgi:peptide/nickel transport system substrate-binding protein
MAVTDELAAEDDRTIRFRLKRPFPLLYFALAKMTPPVCFMMPERLAATDPMTAITEAVGSGPFRFVAGERVPGSRNVYIRNENYVPRADGPIEGSAGPKQVFFDRVEWLTIPDAGTAAAALQAGEVDWVENVAWDLLPVLARRADLRVWVQDPSGTLPLMRMNHLHPPFNDARVRRALLPAIVQSDYLRAVVGDDRSMWQEGVGFFTPGSAMASDVGLEALTGPRSVEAARAALAAAGYHGEPVTVLAGQDIPFVKALAEVAADMLQRIGMTVDYAVSDWATVAQRRANRNPPAQGGWNLFCTSSSGGAFVNPAVHDILRANGAATWPGWPDIPALEALRDEWMAASDLPAQQAIARQMQALAFSELPYIPLGMYQTPTAHRRSLTGMISGPTAFWNLRRAA